MDSDTSEKIRDVISFVHSRTLSIGVYSPGDISVTNMYEEAASDLAEIIQQEISKAKELNFITYIKNNRVQALDADHISITDSGISFGKTNPLFERVVIEYDKEEKAIRFRKPSDGEYGISYKVGVNPASGVYGFRARSFIGILPNGYYRKISDHTYLYTELTLKEHKEEL